MTQDQQAVAFMYETDDERWLSFDQESPDCVDCDFKVVPLYAIPSSEGELLNEAVEALRAAQNEPPAAPPEEFDPIKFGANVSSLLTQKGLSYRAGAVETGVSHATLNRVARGNMPDVPTYLRLLKWLSSAAEGELLAAAIYAVEQLADGNDPDLDEDGDEIDPIERLRHAIARAKAGKAQQ